MTTGIWLTDDESTEMTSYEDCGTWSAKIVSSDNPKATLGRDVLQNCIQEKWQMQRNVVCSQDRLTIRYGDHICGRSIEHQHINWHLYQES